MTSRKSGSASYTLSSLTIRSKSSWLPPQTCFRYSVRLRQQKLAHFLEDGSFVHRCLGHRSGTQNNAATRPLSDSARIRSKLSDELPDNLSETQVDTLLGVSSDISTRSQDLA